MNHYCWQYVKNGNHKGLYDYEIALRKWRCYPPFTDLALLRISYPMDRTDGLTQLAWITALLRSESEGVTVLDPTSAPLSLLRGRRRFQCPLKAGDWQSIRALYAVLLPLASLPNLRIPLDIDPVNML